MIKTWFRSAANNRFRPQAWWMLRRLAILITVGVLLVLGLIRLGQPDTGPASPIDMAGAAVTLLLLALSIRRRYRGRHRRPRKDRAR